MAKKAVTLLRYGEHHPIVEEQPFWHCRKATIVGLSSRFRQNDTLILPDSWKGRCALEQSEFSKVYQVYNPAIRKALIGGDEGQTGGVLFYIRCWDEQLTKEQVDAGGEWDYALCRYIMTTKDGTYLLYYASGVQCTPETMEKYRQMESEIGDIRFVVDNALN